LDDLRASTVSPAPDHGHPASSNLDHRSCLTRKCDSIFTETASPLRSTCFVESISISIKICRYAGDWDHPLTVGRGGELAGEVVDRSASRTVR
jgi:hypothetical protein